MNYCLLKSELNSKNINLLKLGEILKISRTALYRKMNGQSDFTRSEIQVIINTLELDKDKTESIFFGSKVS